MVGLCLDPRRAAELEQVSSRPAQTQPSPLQDMPTASYPSIYTHAHSQGFLLGKFLGIEHPLGEHMARGDWQAMVHKVRESDMTGVTQPAEVV